MIKIGEVLAWLTVIAVLGFGVYACGDLVKRDRAEAEAIAEQQSEKYGVQINPWQQIRCVNNWLMIKNGSHDWAYPRDENFEPIRCEKVQ